MTKFLAVLVLVLAGCTVSADPPGPPSCDRAFQAWAEAGFSGTVTITTGGRLDCAAGYGMADAEADRPNTADTVFDLGSITKAFTSAAVFALIDDGRLTLDTPAGQVVPELRGPVAGVTVDQLLLHTSGLSGTHGDGDYLPLSREEAIASISGLEQAFPPGTDTLYSNAGYTLLALMIHELTGGYREFVASELPAGGFWAGEPAAPGPRAVGYLSDGRRGEMGEFAGPHWATDGNGGLAMTTVDLAEWTRALFTGSVVSAESTKTIAEPGFDLGDGQWETRGWVAHDESRFGTPFLTAAGGGGDVGHNVVVAWVPDLDRVVAVASNGPDVTAEDLLAAVGPALLAGEPLPEPPPREPGAAVTPGTYELDTGGSFDVKSDPKVTITANGPDAMAALFPPDPGAAAHESMVLDLLAGQTQEGREERATVEQSLGPISKVQLAGTVTKGSEHQTYVLLTAGGQTLLGWYSLNQAGGVEGAELPTTPATQTLTPAGDTYTGPAITATFTPDEVTITTPTTTVTAALAD